MSELVESVRYEGFDLDKAVIETYVDDSTGIETTSITFYLQDGFLKSYSFERQM